MKRNEIKAGEAYAIGTLGSGPWDVERATLAVVLRAGEVPTRSGDVWSRRTVMKPGWVCRIEEGHQKGEEVTIPSRQVFHTADEERQRREHRVESQRREDERDAALSALAVRLGGRAVPTRSHVELTPAQAQILVDRLDALEREQAPT